MKRINLRPQIAQTTQINFYDNGLNGWNGLISPLLEKKSVKSVVRKKISVEKKSVKSVESVVEKKNLRVNLKPINVKS